LFYGPLLDRFGRKPPLYAGLSLFTVASLGCIAVRSPELFIAFRLLQALGGCVAQVGAVAMVRDFFPARESAKILSLLMLVLSVSPLFAPSIGSVITTSIGWPWIFVALAGFAVLLMIVIRLLLPEGHWPDPQISLLPRAILEGFHQILIRPQFYTYALAGAFAFAGLFVYVAGSPIVFIDGFQVGPQAYGLIFAVLACGFIGGSQLNIWLSRRHADRKIFRVAVICQDVIMLIIVLGTFFGWYSLAGTVVLLLAYLPFCGIAYPNAAAIALAPLSKKYRQRVGPSGFSANGHRRARLDRGRTAARNLKSRGVHGDGRDCACRPRHPARQSQSRSPHAGRRGLVRQGISGRRKLKRFTLLRPCSSLSGIALGHARS
jgi:DHA1 family bicyclomycin/chloramphenicol resistance-like MFS transporter